MLKISQVYFYCSNLNNRNEKINYLISLLKKEKMYLDNQVLKIVSETNLYNKIHLSKQEISHSNYVGLSNIEKQIYEKIEHELVLKKIVDSINNIQIKENKIIFIEHYLFSYTSTKICENHYLSQASYYLRLHEAEDSFLRNMKI